MSFVSGKPNVSSASSSRKSYVSAEDFAAAYRTATADKNNLPNVADLAAMFGYTVPQLISRVKNLNKKTLESANSAGITLRDEHYLLLPTSENNGKRGRKKQTDEEFLTKIMGITLPE